MRAYERNERSVFRVLLRGVAFCAIVALFIGIIAWSLGAPLYANVTFDGKVQPLPVPIALVLIVLASALVGFFLVLLIGLPLWLLGSSIFAKHWIVAILIGPLLTLGLAGRQGRLGVSVDLGPLVFWSALTGLLGFVVWYSAYRRRVADPIDVF